MWRYLQSSGSEVAPKEANWQWPGYRNDAVGMARRNYVYDCNIMPVILDSSIIPCGLMPITARSKQVTRQHPGTSVARILWWHVIVYNKHLTCPTTRRIVGIEFPEKKLYVILEWPLILNYHRLFCRFSGEPPDGSKRIWVAVEDDNDPASTRPWGQGQWYDDLDTKVRSRLVSWPALWENKTALNALGIELILTNCNVVSQIMLHCNS